MVSKAIQCGFESHSGHVYAGQRHAVQNVRGARDHRFMYSQVTVDRALWLSEQGLIDREIAQICGVSLGAVRKWRTGTRRAPRPVGDRSVSCPRCHGRPLDHAAYAYLLGLYLGDGHITVSRKGVYALSIWCSTDWPGLRRAAVSVMSAVMPTSAVFRVERGGCTEVKSTAKHWLCLFPQHGPGKKHERTIALTPWQREIMEAQPGDFARGLFHSDLDGYRGMNRVRQRPGGDRLYEYPRYLFSNKSVDILLLCGEALDMLGVEWRFSRPDTISVARRAAVARLDEFVGPKY